MKRKPYRVPRMNITDTRTTDSIAMIISSEGNDEQWTKRRDEDPYSDTYEQQEQTYGNLW